MNNIMLDIETMGTVTDSAIVAIGAVRFDADGVTDKFEKVVNLASCLFAGFDIDVETIKWWRKQSKPAQKVLLRRSVTIGRALSDLAEFMGKGAIVWGNGSDFDNTIVDSAYRKLDMITPWEFWHNRCYRSIKALYPDVDYVVHGIKHNAVDDATSQALHLIKMIGDKDML